MLHAAAIPHAAALVITSLLIPHKPDGQDPEQLEDQACDTFRDILAFALSFPHSSRLCLCLLRLSFFFNYQQHRGWQTWRLVSYPHNQPCQPTRPSR